MKRGLLAVVLAAVGIAGVDMLGDLTQTRPESVPPGTRSEIILEVRNRDGNSSSRMAEGLWGACQGTVRQNLVEPGIQPIGGRQFQIVTQPALGKQAWRRLKGCFEDATLDRLMATVVSKRDLPATGN